MASPHPHPLPKGLDAIAAGRIGLWLLGKRSHNAASLRTAFPHRATLTTVYTHRFVRLIVPWRIFEYPGAQRFLASLLGVSSGTANNLLKPSVPLPAKHALRLAEYLTKHASECDALAAELRAYAAARKFTNKSVARSR